MPLATDVERGWIVLPDGGNHLDDLVSGHALVEAMVTVLPRYAELQRAVSVEVASVLDAGVFDMRADALPQRFEETLELVAAYVDRHGTAADRTVCERIIAERDSVTSWFDRLAASPVPPSLDHNDLHPWNVLVRDADALDQPRFYDWGDSVVAHPFASMLLPLHTVQDHLQVALDDALLLRVRDAYLEVFGDLGSHAELVDELELACRFGNISRAITWVQVLAMQPGNGDRSFAGAPFRWLANLLQGSYLGGE